MGNGNQCGDVLSVAHETFVLGIRLVNAEIQDFDRQLVAALQSEAVQSALQNAVADLAKEQLTQPRPTQLQQDPKAVAQKIVAASGKALEDELLAQIQRTPKYQALEKSAQSLVDTLKCSPTGVWVERNKTWLYIVGIGSAIAGAFALYRARAGDPVAVPAMKWLGEQEMKFVEVGKIQFSGALTQFQPSRRTVGARIKATGNWTGFKVELSVEGVAADQDLKVVGRSQVIIPVTHDVVVTPSVSVEDKQKKYTLHLGLDVTSPVVKFNILADVQDNRLAGGSLSVTPGKDVFKNWPVKPGLTLKKDDHQLSGLLFLQGTW